MSWLVKVMKLLVVTVFTPATAHVNDSDLFPYLESAGSFRYYFADDGNVEVYLQKSFKFLGITYSAVYISGNGYISFGTGVGSAGYACNNYDATTPTVAVYMADADNRSDMDGAKLLYRQDRSNSSLNKISKDVFAAYPHLEGQITLNWMLIATWYNIPPYDGIRALVLRNTYQAILTTDTTGNYSFILMYYSNITWPELTQGDTAARVGIYGGKETVNNHFFLIPGSCSYSLLNIGQMSNFEQPGKLAFKVDTRVELPSVSKCINSNDNRVLDVEFKPYIVSPLQKLPLSALNLKFCLDVEVNGTTCIFYDNRGRQAPKEVFGRFYPGQYSASCSPPDFDYSLGKMRVDVRLSFKDGNQVLASGYVYVIKMPYEDKLQLDVFYDDTIPSRANLTANWAESDVRWSDVEDSNGERSRLDERVNLQWSVYDLNGLTWAPLLTSTARHYLNETVISTPLSFEALTTLGSERLETTPRVVVITNHNVWQFRARVPVSLASDIVYTTMFFAKLKINSTGNSVNVYDKKCKQWHDHEPEPPNDTLACPPTLVQAIEDWRFSLDINSVISASPIMNPQKYTVYLQSVPSPSGAGSQCSYDNQGNLVIGNAHGSRMHRYSPNNWRDYWEYYWDDIMPYLQCCELSNKKEENCARFYYPKRPVKFDYTPPVPFRASGATNIATLEGTTYLLNDIGTFYLLKYENQFEIQILSERYFGQNSTNNSAVITSAAIRILDGSSTLSKFQISANETGGLLIWQDNQPVNFYYDSLFNTNHNYKKESFTVYHEGVSVLINGTSEALFSFNTGFSVKFMLSYESKSLNIIGSASPKCKSCVGAVTGLIGNCDGDSISINYWRIPKNESLFQFPVGKTYENYNNVSISTPQLMRVDLLHSVPDNVKILCGNVDDCQVDYILTNDEDIAKSSIVAYEQFEKMLNATKIRNDPSQCSKMIIQNGRFVGTNLNIGAMVKPACEPSYYLNNNSNWTEEASFICVPSNFLTRYNNATTLYPENGLVWVTSTFFQPISNFLIECKPLNNSVSQNITDIHITSGAKHCAYPGDNDFGIQTLVVGSELPITCPVHGKIENVTFTCMDQGYNNELFDWIAVNNPFLSLNACLTAKNELVKSLYSTGSSGNSSATAVTLLSITTIVLFVAVVVLLFYVKKKSSGLSIMATYSRPSMTTNLLESHDSIDN